MLCIFWPNYSETSNKNCIRANIFVFNNNFCCRGKRVRMQDMKLGRKIKFAFNHI